MAGGRRYPGGAQERHPLERHPLLRLFPEIAGRWFWKSRWPGWIRACRGSRTCFSGNTLQRVGYDDKGEFLYRGIAHGTLLYATREALDRLTAPEQALTGIHVGYEADARITDPADMETLRRLETIRGETVPVQDREQRRVFVFDLIYVQ